MISTVLLVCWRVNNKLVNIVGEYDRLDLRLEVIHKMKCRNSAIVFQFVRMCSSVRLTLFWNIREWSSVRSECFRNVAACPPDVVHMSSVCVCVCVCARVRVEFNQFKRFLWHHNSCYCVSNTAAYMKLCLNFITLFSISTKKPVALLTKYMHIFWVLYFHLYKTHLIVLQSFNFFI
jgi:hypothetical protein